jgi:hypothetical protein
LRLSPAGIEAFLLEQTTYENEGRLDGRRVKLVEEVVPAVAAD